MRKKVIQKMTALFLTAILCAGLCSDFAVKAEEGDTTAEEQSGQAETDQAGDVLTETGQSKISEKEEGEQDKSETDELDTVPEESNIQEEQDTAPEEQEEQGQPEALEYSDEEPQTEPEDEKEPEQSETWEQIGSASRAVTGLRQPRILTGCDKWMKAKQEVTWDCVYFGSYPQSEVLKESDPELYEKLKKIDESKWVKKDEYSTMGETKVDGNLYRRITRNDASHSEDYYGDSSEEGEDSSEENKSKPTFYQWDDYDTYHYFKYEPVKWRVLSVDGDQALLLSDMALDTRAFQKTRAAINWDSSLRNWLNGLDGFEDDNFIDTAFTKEQSGAIIEQDEKVFLLSAEEVSGSGEETKKYGFVKQPESVKDEKDKIDEARQCMSSNYAFAMGAMIDPFSDGYPKNDNCYWWLRSEETPYEDIENEKKGNIRAYVSAVGIVYTAGDWEDSGYYGIRPALRVNLSKAASLPSGQWEKAGTVCSNGTVKQEGEDSGGNTENPNPGDDTGNSNAENPNPGGTNAGNSNTGSPNTGKPSTGTTSKKAVKVSKITLSGISKKIAAGKKIKLTAKVYPAKASNKSLTWKVSNKKVATVNSKGVVTLKKNSGGKTVTITATAKDGSKKKATYKITSMKGTVKKITIAGKGTKTVKAGKTVSLKAKVTASNSKKANKKLKWASSNIKYATVTSAGKVKTKKAGKGKKVKITAAATDGSGKKKTVTIKIR